MDVIEDVVEYVGFDGTTKILRGRAKRLENGDVELSRRDGTVIFSREIVRRVILRREGGA
jgi:hypothetical protein